MNLKTFVAAVCIASISSVAVAADCNYKREVRVLALNMYHEARGEGTDAMQMVGEVTLNRVQHDAFPDNTCDVVYQRKQFSWTHMKRDHTPYEKEVWEEALELAENLLNGEIEYFDNGATHFLNPDKVKAIPRWAREFKKVGRIGNHNFYAM
jgi:spore germination cell wall hydrolase CwlJ-like protein